MNSRVILLVLCLVLVDPILGDDWADFKSQHGKNYESRAVEAMRRATRNKSTRNKQLVDQFNADESEEAGYKLGLNHLSDWTESELKQLRGFKLPQNHENLLRNSPHADKFLEDILNDNTTKVPELVDWRKVPNRVTPVKDQGKRSRRFFMQPEMSSSQWFDTKHSLINVPYSN